MTTTISADRLAALIKQCDDDIRYPQRAYGGTGIEPHELRALLDAYQQLAGAQEMMLVRGTGQIVRAFTTAEPGSEMYEEFHNRYEPVRVVRASPVENQWKLSCTVRIG